MNDQYDINIKTLDATLLVRWDEEGGETKEEYEARRKDAEGKFVYQVFVLDLSNQKGSGHEGVKQKVFRSEMFLPEAAPHAFINLMSVVRESISTQMQKNRVAKAES